MTHYGLLFKDPVAGWVEKDGIAATSPKAAVERAALRASAPTGQWIALGDDGRWEKFKVRTHTAIEVDAVPTSFADDQVPA